MGLWTYPRTWLQLYWLASQSRSICALLQVPLDLLRQTLSDIAINGHDAIKLCVYGPADHLISVTDVTTDGHRSQMVPANKVSHRHTTFQFKRG